ncbi:hypothetical protein [Maridesulfovibrio bastinii]|uniref:hypothetical protein n=1 Tax=Maridesulfovibrio bastinii TaxID=47157 RepID=UPI00040107AC|nr:hypothetical protein [Maridesulfovibrio bastinii]
MTKTITKHIEFLRKECGSYSGSARFLRIDPRLYRDQRKSLRMSNSARRSLVLAAKYLQLRRAISLLRDEYGVPVENICASIREAKH